MEMAKIDAELKLEEQKIQIQMEMEKARLAQDKELAEQRMARDDARLRRTELDQIAKDITPWQDHDQPAPFLRKFEDCMMAAEIHRDHWPKRLLPLLTGKAATAYTCHVPTEAKDDYPKLREAMLTAMGKSKDACRRQFWNYRRKPMEPLTEVLRDLQWMTTRLLEDCKTMEEATAVMTTGKFLSLFSLEDADYVRQRKPSTTLDYAITGRCRLCQAEETLNHTWLCHHWKMPTMSGRGNPQPHLIMPISWQTGWKCDNNLEILDHTATGSPDRITDHPTCQMHGKNLYSHILRETINLVYSSTNRPVDPSLPPTEDPMAQEEVVRIL